MERGRKTPRRKEGEKTFASFFWKTEEEGGTERGAFSSSGAISASCRHQLLPLFSFSSADKTKASFCSKCSQLLSPTKATKKRREEKEGGGGGDGERVRRGRGWSPKRRSNPSLEGEEVSLRPSAIHPTQHSNQRRRINVQKIPSLTVKPGERGEKIKHQERRRRRRERNTFLPERENNSSAFPSEGETKGRGEETATEACQRGGGRYGGRKEVGHHQKEETKRRKVSLLPARRQTENRKRRKTKSWTCTLGIYRWLRMLAAIARNFSRSFRETEFSREMRSCGL